VPTPRTLRIAAAVVAVQAGVLVVWGVAEIVRSLTGHPHDRGTAVLLGVVVLVYGLGVLAAARGLAHARRWAQTPTYLVQFFSVVIGVGQVHTLPGLMIPLIALAVIAVVAVSMPDSRQALGGV
jgi:hypothetical protein